MSTYSGKGKLLGVEDGQIRECLRCGKEKIQYPD